MLQYVGETMRAKAELDVFSLVQSFAAELDKWL